MKFVQLTDTHVRSNYDDEKVAMFGKISDAAENVRKILHGVDWKSTDFIVITGDLVHEGEREDYIFLKNLIEENIPSDKKVLYVLGNHDGKEAFYEAFYGRKEEKSYYYVEYVDGYRLIILDSAIAGKEAGTILPEQLEWLKKILSQPSEKGSMIFVHHPLFWSDGNVFPMEVTNSEEVMDVLEGSDVFAIFCGHTHQNATNTRNGLVQYTSDSAAFSLELRNKTDIAFTDKAGYFNVTVEGQDIAVYCETVAEANVGVSFPIQSMVEALKGMNGAEKMDELLGKIGR